MNRTSVPPRLPGEQEQKIRRAGCFSGELLKNPENRLYFNLLRTQVMLSKNSCKALNRHLIEILGYAYMYLQFSARLDSLRIPGAAQWMKNRSVDELKRASVLIDFLSGHGHDVVFDTLDKPDGGKLRSPEEIFGAALKQEMNAAARIRELSDYAVSENDFHMFRLLYGFAAGQAAAERKLRSITEKFRIAGDSASARTFLDSHFPLP